MRNHIVFKFIAVLLCAASLLGVVAGGIGVFSLTGMDLYDKTVEQVYQERILELGRNFSDQLALEVASRNLGGFSDSMLESVTEVSGVRYRNEFAPEGLGYSLRDFEGRILARQELKDAENAVTFQFDVSGQYMHLVEVIPHEDRQPAEPHQNAMAADAVLVNEIPAEGAAVYELQISFPDSSIGGSGGYFGTVFCNREGIVILRCPGWGNDETESLVTAISLYDAAGNLIYEASAGEGIGRITYMEDGELVFTSFSPDGHTEPVPIVLEEPVPVTTEAQTVPATTAPVETEPQVTEAATEPEATEETAEETTPDATEAAVAAAAEETTESTEATEMTEPPTEPEPTVAETRPVETAAAEETLPAEEAPLMINGRNVNTYQINRTEYYDPELGEWATAKYVYVPMPAMTMELQMSADPLRNEFVYELLAGVRMVRRALLPAIGACLLLFAVCGVYLCCAAGRKPKTEELRAGGLNRIPLDLYGVLTVAGAACGIALTAEGGTWLMRQNLVVGAAIVGTLAYFACLLAVGFGFAVAAQVKTPGGFWWRNSLCGRVLKLCRWAGKKLLVFAEWLEEKLHSRGVPGLKALGRKIWQLTAGLFRWMGARVNRFAALLPLTWQWILMGGLMLGLVFVTVAGRFDLGMVLSVLFAVVLILYGANCFGKLQEAVRKMSRGDLGGKVDDKRMVGAFRDFAQDLNDLADVAKLAAQKQLKSERMKTELITNVSHDIKTPLTSIINYVDLLQKPHTEEEGQEYLEVLDRQSQRLKKLIDDLMDMSKASTGNMTVEITVVDAVESVNQALGEFADKLDKVQLVPVFRHLEDSAPIMADGRLVWRVLSNLLSNAVKYAMPGTRLYIDLMRLDDEVVLSLKNISRDELNVDAEELMERFVRGDDSRNPEGSGLGLNIAKSLMELQKGQLELLVDGDLFKVTLIFPGA